MSGPTLEEVEAACNGFSRMYPDLATTWTDEMWHVLNAAEPIIRARHVREAVEGLSGVDAPEADFIRLEWVGEDGQTHEVQFPRAALLAALTGEGT